MKKIKVLRIIARLNIGGPAWHTVLLSEGLDKNVFETILVHGKVNKNEGDMTYLTAERGINPIVIPELCRKISWKNDLIALTKLYRLIRKERPDIVHTHTAKAGALGRLAALLSKLSFQPKLIHTFHGHVLSGYFGRVKSKIFILIERFLAGFTDKIIVVSEAIKKDILFMGIGNEKKVEIVPLGFELDKFLDIPSRNDPALNIGIIGRLVLIKNHKMFLDAVKMLLNDIPALPAGRHGDIRFFIIGDGELRRELEEYAKVLGLGTNVAFTGWQKNLSEVYRSLDIVALTSLNEGTPVSLIEAMAAGKPVVATDAGGVRDLLSSNLPAGKAGLKAQSSKFKITERGILVGSGDVQGFAQGLSRLLNDRQLREEMGRAGREFVKHRFSKKRLIEDIENLYKKEVAI